MKTLLETSNNSDTLAINISHDEVYINITTIDDVYIEFVLDVDDFIRLLEDIKEEEW